MITFEEAVKIAKDTKTVSKYTEYKEVYVFEKEIKSDELVFGGVDAPIVIDKTSGEVYGLNYYAVRYPKKLYEKNVIKQGVC